MSKAICRHCGASLVSDVLRGWISVRYDRFGDAKVFTRFCPRERGDSKRAHAPIPIGDRDALEKWLDA